MKRSLMLLLCTIGSLCGVSVQATLYDNDEDYMNRRYFTAANSQGIELRYGILSDSTIILTSSGTMPNYPDITSDTIIVPENVVLNDTIYTIVTTDGGGVFYGITSLTTVYLPKSISLIGDTIKYNPRTDDIDAVDLDWDMNNSFLGCPNLQNIYVDEANPYYTSIDGVVYSKDKKQLVVYPCGRKDERYAPIEGCEDILRYAFVGHNALREIEFPNSLKTISHHALMSEFYLKRVVLKDSIEALGMNALPKWMYKDESSRNKRTSLPRLDLGARLNRISTFALPATDTIYCYALTPPTGFSKCNFVKDTTLLFVPRSSINAYRSAFGWNQTSRIYPIEPPIVAGVDNATVSWVQNFSATGYVWTLYSDAAHTQVVMTLTFDQRGYLKSIVLGNAASAPQRALAQTMAMDNVNGGEGDGNGDGDSEGDGEKRFAEYYSFTISSLNRNTKYYYIRQSLSDDQIIDEESGSFDTSDKTPTGVDTIPAFDGTAPDALKIISNGNIYILRNGKVYTSTGVEVK